MTAEQAAVIGYAVGLVVGLAIGIFMSTKRVDKSIRQMKKHHTPINPYYHYYENVKKAEAGNKQFYDRITALYKKDTGEDVDWEKDVQRIYDHWLKSYFAQADRNYVKNDKHKDQR